MRDRRVLVKMTDEEYSELERLAEVNTSGNTSQLIRSLVKRAYMLPSEFGLLPPSENAPESAPAPKPKRIGPRPRPRVPMPEPGQVPPDKAQAEAERRAALLAQAAGRKGTG